MKRTQIKPLLLAIASCLYFSTSLKVALADDTEIYVPKQVPADQQVRPNILLILDTSGSMTSTVPGSGKPTKQRIQVLREVVHNLVHDLKDKNVNLGFMRFHGSDGGAVTKAVEQLTPSNAETFLDKINSTIKAGGNTPMSETYYEAYLYLAGKSPVWGKYSSTHQNGTDRNALTDATRNGSTSHLSLTAVRKPILSILPTVRRSVMLAPTQQSETCWKKPPRKEGLPTLSGKNPPAKVEMASASHTWLNTCITKILLPKTAIQKNSVTLPIVNKM
mgnify:CR=1 FL=1